MDFDAFLARFKADPFIDSRLFGLVGEDPQQLRNQVRGWVKKGRLIKLKKGLYLFSDSYRPYLDAAFVANNLVQPSYLSLEYALSFYGLIPEAIKRYTSVTIKKPKEYANEIGSFMYRHMQPRLFWGYVKRDGILIALPEKALLDYIYLNGPSAKKIAPDYFIDGMRIQKISSLSFRKLEALSARFSSGKISAAIKELKKIWKKY